jgi:hypothetical protein
VSASKSAARENGAASARMDRKRATRLKDLMGNLLDVFFRFHNYEDSVSRCQGRQASAVVNPSVAVAIAIGIAIENPNRVRSPSIAIAIPIAMGLSG